jgi:Family of unknown function (DUF6314)
LDVQDANVNDANGQASHPSAPDVRPWGHREQVFNHLPGRWLLERSIEGIATMQGHALFAPAEGGRLHYREDGRLVLANGSEFDSAREYIYAPREHGFRVLFQENPPRLFHEIALTAGQGGEWIGQADHPCGEDHYRTFYRFLPDGRFVIRHVVTGPRKGYTMVTTYRASSPAV